VGAGVRWCPTALPMPPSWIYGVLLLREGEGGREKGKGWAKKGGKGRERMREGKGERKGGGKVASWL